MTSPKLLLPEIPADMFASLGIDGKGVTARGAQVAKWSRSTELKAKLAIQAALVFAAEHPELVAEHHRKRIAGAAESA